MTPIKGSSPLTLPVNPPEVILARRSFAVLAEFIKESVLPRFSAKSPLPTDLVKLVAEYAFPEHTTKVRHHIDIYENLDSRAIGEEIHIGFVHESAIKLNNFERVTIPCDDNLGINNIELFAPEVRCLAEETLMYRKGDYISVSTEIGYIEKCLSRIFRAALWRQETGTLIYEETGEEIFQLKTLTLFVTSSWMTVPKTQIPTIDLPDFPKEEPDITFAPPVIPPKRFEFPS